jgi:hypothetical protein
VNPWLIAALCALGSGVIAWGAMRLRLRWALVMLSVLLAAISLQLFVAARGEEGFHDLAALVAQAFTVVPALAGVAAGMALAAVSGHRPIWRDRVGVLIILALLLAAAVAAATFLI